MIYATAIIEGNLVNCDESLIGLDFGNGYSAVKRYIEEYQNKGYITNGKNELNFEYDRSKLTDKNGDFFVCLCKSEIFQIDNELNLKPGHLYTEKDLSYDCDISKYIENERSYLNIVINLCRLFKEGNIGLCDVFIKVSFKYSIINNKNNYYYHNESRNFVDNRRFCLSNDEKKEFNNYISMFLGMPYDILKTYIDMFSCAFDQIDIATGFEKYITVLEMLILKSNQNNKKQRLASRISVLVGKSDEEICHLHQKMLNFYRYRSESVHDGTRSNITYDELYELESITRRSLRECLNRSEIECRSNCHVTWSEVKEIIIDELREKVTEFRNEGILPNE